MEWIFRILREENSKYGNKIQKVITAYIEKIITQDLSLFIADFNSFLSIFNDEEVREIAQTY